MPTYLVVKARNGKRPHAEAEVQGRLTERLRRLQLSGSRWFLIQAETAGAAESVAQRLEAALLDWRKPVPRKLKKSVLDLGRGTNP